MEMMKAADGDLDDIHWILLREFKEFSPVDAAIP
jgi:hypothetical protein